MAEKSKISVILTSYNHAKYLREAIDSVLNQTYSDFELIIWDDASIDGSWKIINDYSDPRIRAFRNDTNQRGGNIQRALAQGVDGEYIAIQHSDDVWESQKLEKQVAFLDENPQIGAVFTKALIINEDGALFQDQTHFYYNVFDQPNRTRHEWLNHFFYNYNALCHPSLLIRRQCYEDCGLYKSGLAVVPDLDMWVRLCMKYEIHVLPEKLVRFRVRENELNTSGNRPETRIRWSFEFLQILNNYRSISSIEEIIKIFPDAKQYNKPEGYDLDFALAMVAFESNSNNMRDLFGLSILFEILNEPSRSKKIKEIYGFSHKDFIALTARCDVFSVELIASLSNQAAEKEQAIQSLTTLTTTLNEIYSSRGWKILQKLLAVRLAVIPSNSLRESFFHFLLKPRWANPKGFIRRVLLGVRAWFLQQPTLRRMASTLLSPQVRAKLNRVVQSSDGALSASGSPLSSKTPMDWEDYLRLSQNIKTARQAKLAAFTPKRPSMINLDGKNLLEIANSLTFEQQEKPEVSIVIPVHNHGRLTLECLTSVIQYTNSTTYQVVIVDDGSDEVTSNLLQTISNISLLRNHERIGFTQSCNKGADAASGKYLVFLNNDTQVVTGWLGHLLNTYKDHSCVGAVGPKVIYPDGRLQEAGALINQDGTATLIGLADDPNLPRYNYDREIDYCSGVCLLMEADIFRSAGKFDEVYTPAYYEDVDLCLKLRKRGKKIFYSSKATIIHHLSATSQEIDADFKLKLVSRNRLLLLERWQGAIDELNLVKLIAFYLPQYHPIPENDLWWGKGFTEWANVTRAQPNYEGHYQPHLPADLGFYDLRISAVMEQQVELAKRYGIHGFCFYYYWFGGKRILEMPLERMLETGRPDFPFCLCWANENWSRRWDGSEDHLLLAQKHSDEDDRAVIIDMIRYISHPNYILLDGKPIILIYRISLFPNINRTAQIWREVCRENNIGEIHLVMVESFEKSLKIYDPHEFGLDAAIEFPPHNMATAVNASRKIINPHFSGLIMNYADEALKYINRDIPGHTHYKNVMPSWDNTARKQNTSFIFHQANPGAYQAWLEAALEQTREQRSGDHRILFLNAWNEWAEGNHLEPDQRYGHRYLEATLNAQERFLLKNTH
jgi:GT2 family glycosyltransferase